MPKIDETENQFRVRLMAPSRFREGSFRQRKKPIKPSRPQVFGIVGRLMGATTTTLQSLRFPKDQGWTRERVAAWMRTHHASFVKAARSKPLQRPHTCKHCDGPATKALIWAEGRAFIPVCDRHEALARRIVKGNGDSVDRVVALPQITGKAATDEEPDAAIVDDTPKALSEQRKVALIIKADQPGEERFVLGIVLEPEEEDSQTDIYSEEEVRRAAHWFMEHDGTLGLQHEEALGEGAVLLENFLMPVDGVIGGQPVKKGTWIMGWRIVADGIWAAVKAGRFTGFSIGGDSIRVADGESQN